MFTAYCISLCYTNKNSDYLSLQPTLKRHKNEHSIIIWEFNQKLRTSPWYEHRYSVLSLLLWMGTVTSFWGLWFCLYKLSYIPIMGVNSLITAGRRQSGDSNCLAKLVRAPLCTRSKRRRAMKMQWRKWPHSMCLSATLGCSVDSKLMLHVL